MSDEYTPTTDEVRAAYFVRKTGLLVSAMTHYPEFDRWLAERDAEVAAKAWALCDATITEHLVGNTAITAAIASGWPENPYRKAVQS